MKTLKSIRWRKRQLTLFIFHARADSPRKTVEITNCRSAELCLFHPPHLLVQFSFLLNFKFRLSRMDSWKQRNHCLTLSPSSLTLWRLVFPFVEYIEYLHDIYRLNTLNYRRDRCIKLSQKREITNKQRQARARGKREKSNCRAANSYLYSFIYNFTASLVQVRAIWF